MWWKGKKKYAREEAPHLEALELKLDPIAQLRLQPRHVWQRSPIQPQAIGLRHDPCRHQRRCLFCQ